MNKIWGVLFLGLFLCSNSYAAMLSVTTGGYIAASSDVEDTIDNEGASVVTVDGSADTQNTLIIGFQESSNITLTTALPKGSAVAPCSGCGTLALGTSLSKKHELSNGFIEPFARLELGGNLLHNSANYSYYTNNTEVTTYKVDEEERAHVRTGT